jgi:N-acetylneuraminic acid mutarotase
MSPEIRRAIAVSASVLLASCGTEGPPTEPVADRPSLIVIGGDGVTATVGSSVPVTVRVTGVSAPNQQVVSFVVTAGGGSVYSPAVQTARPQSGPGQGQSGIASNVWVYGTTSVPQTLEARLINPINGAVVLVGRLNGTATPGAAAQLTLVTGDGQSAVVGTAVPVAPAVKVSDQFGNGIGGVVVTFAVSQGAGSLTGATPTTNANGIATVGGWTLGPGAGPNQLTATTSPALAGSPALIGATGRAAAAARLVTAQRVFSPRIGTTISPTVQVTDANGNGVANAVVTFTVKAGSGTLDGVGAVATLTDATGTARVDWTVGSLIESNRLQATAQGLTGSPITFAAIPFDCDCWTTGAPLPTTRRDFGGGVINNLIHTVAGGVSGGTYFSVHEVYDPATDQWSSAAPVAAPYAFPASGVIQSRLYLASGFGPPGLLDRVQAYDASLDQWSPLAPIPTRRIGAGAATLGGFSVGGSFIPERMYVVGGDNSGNGTPTAAVEAYDPALDQWISRAPLPTSRFLPAAAVARGRLYAVGGAATGPFQILSRVDAYDPATNSWAAVNPMPTPRYSAAIAVVGDLIYVIGGLDPAKLGVVEVYDPAADAWVTRASMPTPRGGALAALAQVGSQLKIFVLGGRNDTGVEALATNEAYQP